MHSDLVTRFLTYGTMARIGKVFCLLLMVAVGPRAGTASDVTVLALGDSLTQGYGLPEHHGFVPQLEAWLKRKGVAVDVINAGVSGDTTAGGAARVDWSLTPDVDAMIVALGGNDLLRGIDPEVSRENLETILESAAAQEVPVLLVGLDAPSNYGPDYKRAFDAIYPDLSQAYDTLYAKDFFGGLPDRDPSKLREYFQADGIHPNKEGVTLIVEELGPDVLRLIARTK